MPSTIFHSVTCADCGQREAALIIRRSGGDAVERALCEECARSRGIVAGKGRLDIRFEELLASGRPGEIESAFPAACASCGTELASFLRDGRLGCPSCADAFASQLVERVSRRVPAQGLKDRNLSLSARRSSSPESQLREALEAEDYERAAALRDAMASSGARAIPPLANDGGASGFPFSFPAFASGRGSDDDVVLSSSAIVCRDLDGQPFPGAPRGGGGDCAELLLSRVLDLGGWASARMGSLGGPTRRALAERGFVPRSYAADPLAVLAASSTTGSYALFGDEDHLRLKARLPGLDPARAARTVLDIAAILGEDLPFAAKEGIGWICARAADCGLALSAATTLHLPALAATGLHQRLFRALLAQGIAVRGLFSTEEDSAGAVYELLAEGRGAGPDPAAAVAPAAIAAAEAERRARASLAGREARLDLESRSLGIAGSCRLLGADEAARLVSALRLAALAGRLGGAGAERIGAGFGELLEGLGPGSLALEAGLMEAPSGRHESALRAAVIKSAVAGAEYLPEGG